MKAIRYFGGAVLLFALPLSASAVSLSLNGVGQVLIYPYYTVRGSPQTGSPHNTLLSVVNGSGIDAKAVRIRFREALTGASVFEANVFLGERDVWTAAVVPFGDGAGLLTVDGSCTQPTMRSAAAGTVVPAATFSSSAYAADPLGPSIDRVREGYIEILEMGTIERNSPLYLQTASLQGQPASCQLGNDETISAQLKPPTGGLYGSVTLINVLEGTAYGYDAVALEKWSARVTYGAPGAGPTLADANPAMSNRFYPGGVSTSSWNSGIDAVNAALWAPRTVAEFMREPAVNGATDIVYTLPTKPLLVNADTAAAPFRAKLTSNGACETFDSYTYNRAQGKTWPDQGEVPTVTAMCWATTVQSLNVAWPAPTAVVGSRAGLRYSFLGIEFPYELVPSFVSGFVNFDFLGGTSPLNPPPKITASATINIDLRTGQSSLVQSQIYYGLPVVGVTLMRYVNGSVAIGGVSSLSNYGVSSTVKPSHAVGLGPW